MEWLPIAQALREGQSKRIGHDCGPGTCAIVSHTSEGWRLFCFRCDAQEFKGKQLSFKERVARLREQGQADEEAEDIDPPWPAVRSPSDWPTYAAVWLYKAGLSNADIMRLGWFYHKRTDRVVLTVCDRSSGELRYWQARGFDPDRPKYLNQAAADRDSIVAEFGSGPIIVLTEDILSAWKVSTAGFEAWGLLGTKLLDPILLRLMQDERPVAVWLDPDKAGREGAARIIQKLRAVGKPVRRIESAKDPKLMSRKDICHALQNQGE